MEEKQTNEQLCIWDDPQLKVVLKDIERTIGKNVIVRFDETKSTSEVKVIDSGSLLINDAIGIKGYPKGRISEIYGPEASGKTTLSLHAIAQVQKVGGIAAFIDVEHALDYKYAKNIGVDINNLIVSQPENGEQALDLLEALVKSEMVDLVVIDSVAALVPKAELEGEMADQAIGMQARLMSKGLRKINPIIAKTNTAVIFINQVREKIGVVFGNPEITAGGRALRFYSSLRIETRKAETLLRDGEVVGNKVRFKVIKNKLAPKFKTVMLTLIHNQGIDLVSEVIELATINKIFEKAGTWYSYENQKIGQGKEQVKQWLISNVEVMDKIIGLIEAKMDFIVS